MATLRLSNGHDLTVKLSVEESLKALKTSSDDFVEVEGEEGFVQVRPSSVIAIIEDTRRGTAGFRMSAN
jgi:hypothetical protein